jgi:hypothetical protein
MLILKRLVACALVLGAFATPYLAEPWIAAATAEAVSLIAVVAFTCLGLAGVLWLDRAPSR